MKTRKRITIDAQSVDIMNIGNGKCMIQFYCEKAIYNVMLPQAIMEPMSTAVWNNSSFCKSLVEQPAPAAPSAMEICTRYVREGQIQREIVCYSANPHALFRRITSLINTETGALVSTPNGEPLWSEQIFNGEWHAIIRPDVIAKLESDYACANMAGMNVRND